MNEKRTGLLREKTEVHVPLDMFPQYDLTKDVRFELMKNVFGATHLHKRHIFLNKDTEKQFRAQDRQKKMAQIEFERQKQKVENHFLKLLNNSHIPKDDLRYSYNNWPHRMDPRPTHKQETKATLECTVIHNDGKEIYIPVTTHKELNLRRKKLPKDRGKVTKFPLYREMTM